MEFQLVANAADYGNSAAFANVEIWSSLCFEPKVKAKDLKIISAGIKITNAR